MFKNLNENKLDFIGIAALYLFFITALVNGKICFLKYCFSYEESSFIFILFLSCLVAAILSLLLFIIRDKPIKKLFKIILVFASLYGIMIFILGFFPERLKTILNIKPTTLEYMSFENRP